MSLLVNSLSPPFISDPDLPIALRPDVDFPAVRGSVFDDPGDEKSWHVSQRSEGLTRYFEGREPSWYASAIAPLEGAGRVLDLGCGPGLTLAALLERGCSRVLGVDRWPAFTASSTPAAPIVAHDLTLPMPFLASGSFDGVLSHYALDYVSPIGMRQVLREAHRVLVPGGRLVIYVAAVGTGSGDPARTAVYSPPALRTLLLEAGFEEVSVEAPSNGRNSVVIARRRGSPGSDQAHPGEPRTSIEGDTQISAAFSSGGAGIEVELVGSGRRTGLAFDLPPRSAGGSRVSVCVRALHPAPGTIELQAWAWHGYEPVVCERARFEFDATALRVGCAGDVEHVSTWQPGELSIEPPGNAHRRFDEISPGVDLSEAERGAEGRQIVVEAGRAPAGEVAVPLGPGRNRFLVRRATEVNASAIDRQWFAGSAHGLAFEAEELGGERARDLLLWAGWRQALVYLGGHDWEAILAAAAMRQAELRSPVILVDPALHSRSVPSPLPADVAAFVAEHGQFFVVVSAESRRCSDVGDLARISKRILHGGPPSGDEIAMRDANETLRYLAERTMLIRLRQVYGHSPAEVGRRPALR
jgi:SAM-dependent methyltransferase